MQSPASKGQPGCWRPAPRPPPPRFSLGPIESENNEPAPVKCFQSLTIRRQKRKEREIKLFSSGRTKSHLEARSVQGDSGAGCNTRSVCLHEAPELLLALLARSCHGPHFL